MNKLKNRGAYQAYLIRLWSENEKVGWRASATRIDTNEAYFFSNPEKLFEFLDEQLTTTEFDE